jgi:cyclopropane-fatty-acyl-phospholipid synthase
VNATVRLTGEPPARVWVPGAGGRWVVHRLLGRLRRDELTIDECEGLRPHVLRFAGEPTDGDPLRARIAVRDRRAYSAVVREGSVGLGRGYIEGWWTSPDPVAVVRVLIRNMATIDRWRNRTTEVVGPFADRIRSRLPRDSRRRNRDDIAAHYDIGNEFFGLFLDETLTYSSAVFPEPGADLADASRHKYDLLLRKLGVTSDQHLLEIGTGWGGLAIHAAATVGCRVTTTTISGEQLREARRRIEAAGLSDRVTVIDTDWRDLSGRFDHVISIEMIEAVDWRDYDDYFATIARCLAPGGRVAIQAICLPDERWERAKNTEDFIRHFVFPNGYLPSVAALRDSVARSTSLRIAGVDDYGDHYAETLARWRRRFWSRIDDVQALGLDERFCRLWDFYLAYCEAGMREQHCTVVQLALHPDLGSGS